MTLIVQVTPGPLEHDLSDLVRLPFGLDVWEMGDEHVVVRAEEAALDRLEQMGYGVEQLVTTDSYLSTFATAEAVSGYHSAESLESDLRHLAEREPEIAELHEIGRSVENRPLWALRLGERKGSTHKVLFTGCHHAREWVAVEVPYLLALDLVGNADTNPVQEWFSRGEIWIAPMVNPDGHEHSRTEDRLWRKNRRPNPNGSMGVDPNRNYGYMWGTLNVSTSSHVPRDETYVGPRAFSEPETRAVRRLVTCEGFGGVITYHSYSQLILHPWGYTRRPAGESQPLVDLGRRMQELIGQVHGQTYTAKQSSGLYPTAGDTTDWTFGEFAIPSFTVELRPRSQSEGGFMLPTNQIQPTWEENRPAAHAFIDTVFAV